MINNNISSPEESTLSIEHKGFCVIENALGNKELDKLRKELLDLEINYKKSPTDHSMCLDQPTRFMMHNLQFEKCPTVHDLIISSKPLNVVAALAGNDLVCTGCTYAHCKPGYIGVPLHTDYDPNASNLYRPSNPVAMRVIYYLDDLSELNAPFRIIPYSHLSLGKNRHHNVEISERVEGEIQIECKAGTAIIIIPRVFHGTGPNRTEGSRRVLAITYRPRWSPPIHKVEEHPEHLVATLPEKLRSFFHDLNS